MQYQFLPNSKIEDANILIHRVAFGESVSAKKGTADAPNAIVKASEQIEYYDEDLEWSPMKHLDVCVSNCVSDFTEIKTSVEELNIGAKQLLISLGGDHSITPQITLALLKKPATVIFLDAHADLRESYLGDENSHATPAFHLLAQGHKLVMIGVRSLFEAEAIRIKEDKNISYFSDRALQSEVVKKELLEHLSRLEGEVYLSIDMDVFNPAFVPSVGTPQAGGIDYYLATAILQALFLDSNAIIKGVDIVELIPEESNVSQLFAAKLLQKVISYWGVSQGYDKSAMNGAQMQVEYE